MPHTKGITSDFHGLLAKPYGTPDLSAGSGIAFGHATTPFVTAYPWTDQVGFGTKFANPGTLPPATVNGVVFNTVASVVFLAHNSSPFVSAYAWDTVSGWGTKFANPSVLPDGAGTNVAFRRLATSTFDHVALTDSVGVLINVWRFSKGVAGWGTKFGNPASLPVGAAGVKFAPNGLSIAVCGASPFIEAYPWSGSGFGTKYADPAVLAPTSGSSVSFANSGGAIAIGTAFSGGKNVNAWAFSASGYGTKYADPSYPGGYTLDTAQDVAYTKNAIMAAQTLSGSFDQYIGWRWSDSGGFGTRYSALARVPAAVSALAFNLSSSGIFGTYATADRLSARRWNSQTGFGSVYTNPATLPTGIAGAVAVAP